MPKRGQKVRENDALRPRMRRHLGRLGVRALPEYRAWCRAHGFAPSLEKTTYDLEEELEALERDRKRAAEQARLHANPRKLIEAACAGDVNPDEVTRPQLHAFCRSIHCSAPDADSRRSLSKLLLKVKDEADFLLEGVWFVAIGAGESLRTLDTPIPMTKAMAHHFVETPADSSIEGAIRWGQVHALGGGSRLTGALLGTRLAHDFSENEFWTSGLTMRGRTVETLLAQVERRHRELGRASDAESLYFSRSGHKELELKTGKDSANVWRVRELLSGAELIAEGRAMKHCVASYARSCASGHCSIWAMEFTTTLGREKRQTIEVSNEGMIVQCRGKQNRLPTVAEFDILKEWARYAGLSISPYVRAEG